MTPDRAAPVTGTAEFAGFLADLAHAVSTQRATTSARAPSAEAPLAAGDPDLPAPDEDAGMIWEWQDPGGRIIEELREVRVGAPEAP
jgi:hypothetical protein